MEVDLSYAFVASDLKLCKTDNKYIIIIAHVFTIQNGCFLIFIYVYMYCLYLRGDFHLFRLAVTLSKVITFI